MTFTRCLTVLVIALPLLAWVMEFLAGAVISERHHLHHDTYSVSMVVSRTLALVMLFSLFPASAFADAGGEPEENEGQIAPVEESAPSENEGEIAPIDEPAPAEEPEAKTYTLSGRALTFKANGTPDTSNTGATGWWRCTSAPLRPR